MKIVRKGVFETNSSSAHSLTLGHENKKNHPFVGSTLLDLTAKYDEDFYDLLFCIPFKQNECWNCFNELYKGHFKATTPISKLWLLIGVVLWENYSLVDNLANNPEEYKKLAYQILNIHSFTRNIPDAFFECDSWDDIATWEDMLELDGTEIANFYSGEFLYDLDSILSSYEKFASELYPCIGNYGYHRLEDVIWNYLLNPKCEYTYFDRNTENQNLEELITTKIEEKKDEDD